jgi:hypothetical protein
MMNFVVVIIVIISVVVVVIVANNNVNKLRWAQDDSGFDKLWYLCLLTCWYFSGDTPLACQLLSCWCLVMSSRGDVVAGRLYIYTKYVGPSTPYPNSSPLSIPSYSGLGLQFSYPFCFIFQLLPYFPYSFALPDIFVLECTLKYIYIYIYIVFNCIPLFETLHKVQGHKRKLRFPLQISVVVS